jgi:hypothetical protein
MAHRTESREHGHGRKLVGRVVAERVLPSGLPRRKYAVYNPRYPLQRSANVAEEWQNAMGCRDAEGKQGKSVRAP